MLHFGRGDISQSSRANALMESMARGGLVIGGISLFHKAEVELIFQALVGDETGMVWLFLESIVVVTLLSIGLTALTKTGNDRGYFLAEISGLSVLFYLTPPLFGFAFYFCLVHTSRHVSNMQSILKDTISKFNIKGKYPSSITAYMGSRIGDSCSAIQQCWTRGCFAASHIHWTCCANSTSYDSS